MLEESEILPPEQPAPLPNSDMPADPALRGGIRDTLAVALPMVLSLSFDTLMVFVDRLFLSRLSSAHMNAALAGGMANFMLMTFFMGLIGYVTAMVAQRMGGGKGHLGGRILAQALLVVAVAYPVILLLRPLIHLMFASADVDPLQLVPQIQYFDILILGSPIPLIRHAFSSFFSGIGRTRMIMLASLLGMIVNVGLNWLLIFGHGGFPAMGIQGAAIGTLVGGLATTGVLLAAYFSPHLRQRFGTTRGWRPDLTLLRELLRKGSPAGIEMLLNLTAFQFMILLFHGKGLATATAATIMFNWDMVSFVPLLGLEVAATSLVGRYVGARDFAAAQRSTRSGILIGWGFSLVVLAAFVGIPEILVNAFRPNPPDAVFLEAFPTAVFMIRVASLYILIEAIMVVYAGALRGAGDTFWTMVIMVGLHWLLVLLLWLMLYYWDLGARASWMAMVLIFMIFPLLLGLRWRSGAWRKILDS